jgi:hyperosmotically inducible periplasmic protein
MLRLTPFALALTMAAAMPALQAQTQPDNTKVNKRDRSQNAVTADQQKENKSDRELTQAIRKAVVADKSLSTYGHNVKIVTVNGAVTLKGPVHSQEEKRSIVSKAEEVAGKNNVKDELSVKGDSNKSDASADRSK